ncbi:transposase [candidate division WOR-3 bacterium]|nr:transposase [candidate division WOR-3 bacterium]MCK4576281.1 transposase [candidate division WOR-3 bacterium]
MKIKYHKKIRLDSEIYKTPDLPCSITICTRKRKPIFNNKKLAEECLDLMKKFSLENNIPIYAYCIMPDHIHLLLCASEQIGIIEFISRLKNLTTRIAWKHNFKGKIWQKSFYDHFLRKDEDNQKVATYIVNNPVRKGLVQDWRDYPFCGSLVFDLD